MKKTFIGLALLASVPSFAEGKNEMECIQRIADFSNIELERDYSFKGTNESGKCELDLSSELYISGLTNEKVGTLRAILTESVYEDEDFSPSAFAQVQFNRTLSKQVIEKCEIKGNKLTFKSLIKGRTGWENKHSYSIELVRGENNTLKKVSITEKKHRSIFSSESINKSSCVLE